VTRAVTEPGLAYTAISSYAVKDAFWYNYRFKVQEFQQQNELWLGIQRTHDWMWIEGELDQFILITY
jgi:hypothetical protein